MRRELNSTLLSRCSNWLSVSEYTYSVSLGQGNRYFNYDLFYNTNDCIYDIREMGLRQSRQQHINHNLATLWGANPRSYISSHF